MGALSNVLLSLASGFPPAGWGSQNPPPTHSLRNNFDPYLVASWESQLLRGKHLAIHGTCQLHSCAPCTVVSCISFLAKPHFSVPKSPLASSSVQVKVYTPLLIRLLIVKVFRKKKFLYRNRGRASSLDQVTSFLGIYLIDTQQSYAHRRMPVVVLKVAGKLKGKYPPTEED